MELNLGKRDEIKRRGKEPETAPAIRIPGGDQQTSLERPLSGLVLNACYETLMKERKSLIIAGSTGLLLYTSCSSYSTNTSTLYCHTHRALVNTLKSSPERSAFPFRFSLLSMSRAGQHLLCSLFGQSFG